MNREDTIDWMGRWMDKVFLDELPEMLEEDEPESIPSRFWEPQPDEEDLERMANEYEGSELDDEPLPFE